MSEVSIPIPVGALDVEFSAELDDVTYQMRLRWNPRTEGWFLTLMDGDGNAIASSIRVVVGWPLLSHVRGTVRPPGELVAIDTSGTDTEAGRDDLGKRVQLTYVEGSA